jgi:hypothetical protein
VIAPYRSAIANLVTIPGISATAAHMIIAEIGVDTSRFATVADLRSWAGVRPQLNERAGKNHSRRLRHGAPWLKTVLVQCARATSRNKHNLSTLNSPAPGPARPTKKPLSRWPPQSFPSLIICCAIKHRIPISEHSISHARSGVHGATPGVPNQRARLRNPDSQSSLMA